ncbi:RagB/SusD family nutrient uptake outer membrane protein [Aliifodinibius sp. S!AR15-10]|uniref:RagB/SusD family nutrient uptake outer membrane protein n=1 Tax=Aliifodinibius sp. S!AR15-10 TaxID=2950437 RepID=UPI00285969CE|nr:RagB/SusD family nutrient uptake outer membrane protein [Aliifodinibius sp. S!AR15-10]MDR8392809.1 RagB/SusD family nutrient uptake outer membrane protein [Aliifodinibius sp. S!AR15-10]
MKRLNTINKASFAIFFAALVWISGCNIIDIEDRADPNNTELQVVLDNPSRPNLSTLAVGTVSGMRVDMRIWFINHGMIGREMYRFLSAEPRNTGDLLGKENSQLDPGSFYTTRPWSAYYANIRMANILIQAASNSPAVNAEELNGILGFAKTIKAYQYLLALNLTNNNGIRRQVTDDINAVGDMLSKPDGFALIESLLDEAYTDLDNAEFIFNLPPGFSGFDDSEGFQQFNRALQARVAAYQMSDWQAVLDALDNSFIDEDGSLATGVYHDFTTQPNDETNPVFADPQAGSGDSWVAHPSFVADAENGDARVDEKVELRESEAALDGLSSNYGLAVYDSPTASIPIIRNAELILLRAEALINRNQGSDLDDAEDLLNIVRNAADLPDYSGSTTQAALTNEMLNQRRYELFFEGHRWIDMRRYDRLDNLPIDRSGDNVWISFPIPEAENVN